MRRPAAIACVAVLASVALVANVLTSVLQHGRNHLRTTSTLNLNGSIARQELVREQGQDSLPSARTRVSQHNHIGAKARSSEKRSEFSVSDAEVAAHSRLLGATPQAKWVTAQNFDLKDVSRALLMAHRVASACELSSDLSGKQDALRRHNKSFQKSSIHEEQQQQHVKVDSNGGWIGNIISFAVFNRAQGCLLDNFVAHLLKLSTSSSNSSSNSNSNSNDINAASLKFPPLVIFAIDEPALLFCHNLVDAITADLGVNSDERGHEQEEKQDGYGYGMKAGIWIYCVGPRHHGYQDRNIENRSNITGALNTRNADGNLDNIDNRNPSFQAVEYGDSWYRLAVWMKPMFLGLALVPIPDSHHHQMSLSFRPKAVIVTDVDVVLLHSFSPRFWSSVFPAISNKIATPAIAVACEVGNDLATANTGFMIVKINAQSRDAVRDWTAVSRFPPPVDDQAAFRKRVSMRNSSRASSIDHLRNPEKHSRLVNHQTEKEGSVVQCFQPNTIQLRCSPAVSSSFGVHCTEVPDKAVALAEIGLWTQLLERGRSQESDSDAELDKTTGGVQNLPRTPNGHMSSFASNCLYSVSNSWWDSHPNQRKTREKARAAEAVGL